MIQYLEFSKSIEDIELDNKYHKEQLEIINNLIEKLIKDKNYLEERLRFDNDRSTLTAIKEIDAILQGKRTIT